MELSVLTLFIVFCSVNATFDPFAGFKPKTKKKESNNDLSKKLPSKPLPSTTKKSKEEDIMKKMRHVTSVSDFLKTFTQKKGLNAQVSTEGEQAFLMVRHRSIGSDGGVITEEKQVPFATHTPCLPRPKCQDITYLQSEHQGVVFPPCYTYPQCGGCCFNHDIKECVPKTYIEETANIFVLSYEDSTWDIVPFNYKRHTSCTCECKIKKDHCVGGQHYDKAGCHCYCPKTAKRKCSENRQWSDHYCDCVCRNPKNCGNKKIWKEDSCSCQCIKEEKCSKGKHWDVASCHCLNPFFIG